MKKLKPWQQNKVDTLTRTGKITPDLALRVLETPDIDWDVTLAANKILKILNGSIDINQI